MSLHRTLLSSLLGLLCLLVAHAEDNAKFIAQVGSVHSAYLDIHYTSIAGNEQFLGQARGVLVSESGLILTSGQIRLSGRKLSLIRGSFAGIPREFPLAFLGKDEDLDLAFLQIEKASIPATATPIRFDPTAALPALRESVALVDSLPEPYGHAPFVRTGTVMAVLEHPISRILTDLPHDAIADPLPLLSGDGDIIGLLLPGFSGESAVPGLRALPAAKVAPLVAKPPRETEQRERQHGWLGILMGPLDPDLARHWGLDAEGGVIVNQVFEGSPAAAAGLRPGDIMTSFGETRLDVSQQQHLQAFIRLVKSTPTGTRIPIIFMRPTLEADATEATRLSFAEQSSEVELGTRPRSALFETYFQDPRTGLTLKNLSVENRVAFNLDDTVRGVFVLDVEEGSWANLAGVQPGDIIARIDGRTIETIGQYRQELAVSLLKNPEAILLFVRRQGDTVFLVMKPR